VTPSALLLLASILLFVGPLVDAIGAGSRAVHALVDGFTLALVGGLCVVFVLPHAVGEIGVSALALAAVGAALPTMLHRLERGSSWSLGLVAIALGAHVVLDGAVLSVRGDDVPLASAVVAHRLPVGFAIVAAAHGSRRPRWVSWGLAFAMGLATVGGFLFGPTVVAWLPEAGPAGLEALVAGVLLHVVFAPPHHPHRDVHQHDDAHRHDHDDHAGRHPDRDHPHRETRAAARANRWAAFGALGGLFVMFGGASLAGPQSLDSNVYTFTQTLGVLVLESAPALLLGYGLAGVIPFVLTPRRTSSLARGGKLAQSLRGVAFGLPLPVCSCGVLPLYESLIRRGAPPAAAMAFFVATPELGLDAVLLSVPLLGSSLTVARVLSAFAVALLVALLVGGRPQSSVLVDREPTSASVGESWRVRLRAGLWFGFVEVFDHTMPWIALGLVVAAMAEPMLSHGAIGSISPVLQVPVAALIGVPIYVCASGATPVAALALHKGMSAGAAIAFLIAGPATNVTTFGVLARLHGRRTAVRFGIAVTALAVLVGWGIDALGVTAAPVLEAHPNVEAHGSWFAWLCVAALAALSGASLFRQGPRGALGQILEPIHMH
jgi:uncharacterized membrane protein YraQ (UPF0718 family)